MEVNYALEPDEVEQGYRVDTNNKSKYDNYKIKKQTKDLGKTIILLSIIVGRKIKIQIATAKGKREYDKRQDIKKRDWERDQGRILKNTNKR